MIVFDDGPQVVLPGEGCHTLHMLDASVGFTSSLTACQVIAGNIGHVEYFKRSSHFENSLHDSLTVSTDYSSIGFSGQFRGKGYQKIGFRQIRQFRAEGYMDIEEAVEEY